MLQSRREQRRGADWIGAELGIPARTVGAILKRHHVPHLADCDPLSGELIRATRQTRCRYERKRPGELVHMDVKKLGGIPSGGGWRAGGGTPGQHASRLDKTPIGYDYIHSLIDDHFRFAYSEVHADEQGTTCAAFLLRRHPFRDHGIGHIERLMIPGTPAVQSISTEIRPTNTRVATRSRCKITVKNTSDESAQTQGPGAGYTYVQGQTYFTQQFASDLGKWRVGIGPRAWIAPSSRSAGDSAESWRLAKPG